MATRRAAQVPEFLCDGGAGGMQIGLVDWFEVGTGLPVAGRLRKGGCKASCRLPGRMLCLGPSLQVGGLVRWEYDMPTLLTRCAKDAATHG